MRAVLILLMMVCVCGTQAQLGAFWDLGEGRPVQTSACGTNFGWYSTAGNVNVFDSAAKTHVALSNYVSVASYNVCRADFWLRDFGTSSGNLTVRLYANSSTNTPGALLETSPTTIDNSMTTSSYAWITAQFSGSTTLTNGQIYWLRLSSDFVSGVHYYGTQGGANGSGNLLQSQNGTDWSVLSTRQPSFSLYK
jgi:hypothetical protein